MQHTRADAFTGRRRRYLRMTSVLLLLAAAAAAIAAAAIAAAAAAVPAPPATKSQTKPVFLIPDGDFGPSGFRSKKLKKLTPCY